MKTLAQMKARLQELEAAIKETEARLPAHSVKPPVMMDLLALEDEYEALMQHYRTCKARDSENRIADSKNGEPMTVIDRKKK